MHNTRTVRVAVVPQKEELEVVKICKLTLESINAKNLIPLLIPRGAYPVKNSSVLHCILCISKELNFRVPAKKPTLSLYHHHDDCQEVNRQVHRPGKLVIHYFYVYFVAFVK